jgi:ribosome-associated protein
LADHITEKLKEAGYDSVPVEGKDACEWVLVDAGNIVVHLFHPHLRMQYNLEKMWSVPASASSQPEAVL